MKKSTMCVAIVSMIGCATLAGFHLALTTGGQNTGGAGPSTSFESSKKGLSAMSAQSQVEVRLFVVPGPIREHGTWQDWATHTVADIVAHRNASHDVGSKYSVNNVSQHRVMMNNTNNLWFAVWAKRLPNGPKLNPNMFSFREDSSDLPANTLRSRYSTVGGNFVLTPFHVGINWNSNGERQSVVMAGSDPAGYDEIVFIGMQSTYYTYATDAEYANIQQYTRNNNVSITAAVDIVGANGTILGSSTRTLTIGPSTARLLITRNGRTVVIQYHTDPNIVLDLESTTAFGTGLNWTVERTVQTDADGIGEIVITPITDRLKVFRAVTRFP